MKKHRHDRKATDRKVTFEFLKHRHERAKGFPKAKWIEFCEICLDSGCEVFLYEARKTYSKYVTVIKNSSSFKVRFSNHPPIKQREANGDCDFFVGRTNFTITTTDDAIKATAKHFALQGPQKTSETSLAGRRAEAPERGLTLAKKRTSLEGGATALLPHPERAQGVHGADVAAQGARCALWCE